MSEGAVAVAGAEGAVAEQGVAVEQGVVAETEQGFDNFDMSAGSDEGSVEETASDDNAQLVSIATALGADEATIAEMNTDIQQYKSIANDLGLSNEQFTGLMNIIIADELESMVRDRENEKKNTTESLQTLRNELTLDERLAWNPTKNVLIENFGEETAKKICLDINLYRAFLSVKSGMANNAAIKNVPVAKMTEDQARDKRTSELRDALGNHKKVSEIFDRYMKEYPEYFTEE